VVENEATPHLVIASEGTQGDVLADITIGAPRGYAGVDTLEDFLRNNHMTPSTILQPEYSHGEVIDRNLTGINERNRPFESARFITPNGDHDGVESNDVHIPAFQHGQDAALPNSAPGPAIFGNRSTSGLLGAGSPSDLHMRSSISAATPSPHSSMPESRVAARHHHIVRTHHAGKRKS
jgi:hypothetical protein